MFELIPPAHRRQAGTNFLFSAQQPNIGCSARRCGFLPQTCRRIHGEQPPEATAKQLHRIALDHLNDEQGHRVARNGFHQHLRSLRKVALRPATYPSP